MEKKELDSKDLTGISALLIHTAKIDEHYTDNEKKLIYEFIKSFEKKEEIIKKILINAENLEKNSNQLLNFTNIIKKYSLEIKKIIVKELWKIILSDNSSDPFESNLVRKVCGLIYLPDKASGEIKLQVQKELNEK